jgi:hypothetical protein
MKIFGSSIEVILSGPALQDDPPAHVRSEQSTVKSGGCSVNAKEMIW